MKSRRGFTLVELLTVMAVIAVLAAILYPVLASAKKEAKKTTCVSNLKQIGVSMGLYLNDNEQAFPAAFDNSAQLLFLWVVVPQEQSFVRSTLQNALQLSKILKPYSGAAEIWKCPQDQGGAITYVDLNGIRTDQVATPTAYSSFGTSYAYKTELGVRGLRAPLSCKTPEGEDVNDSEIGVFVDSGTGWHGGSDEDMSKKSMNMAYADSHVKFVSTFGPDGLFKSWLLDCGGPKTVN